MNPKNGRSNVKIAIPTIQHTGTHLIAKLFGDIHWAALKEQTDRDCLYVGHISDGQMPHIRARLVEMPAIIPIRHPYRVAESWERRGKGLGLLVHTFKLLVEEVDPLNPYYIAIDTTQRDDQLSQINKDLGLSLTTDWPVRNSYHETHSLEWEDLKPNPMMRELCEEISDFLGRFYPGMS